MVFQLAMPKKYKRDVRQFVMHLLQKHTSHRSIVEFTGISRSTLWRWKTFGIDNKTRNTKSSTMKQHASMAIDGLYTRQLHVITRQIHQHLKQNGFTCSIRSIQRYMKANKMTLKRMKHKRVSKNCTLDSIHAYSDALHVALESEDDVIFQDESYFSKDVLPLYAFSPKGKECVVKKNRSKHDAHTLIFAFSKSGNVFYKVYKGYMNQSRMQWFVHHLPPHTLVMDNLRIHKNVKLDGNVIFTPVAQPDANPVEILFSKIKHNFREFNLMHRNASVEELIDMAIGTLCVSDLSNAIAYSLRFVNDLRTLHHV
jgi:transposase